MDKSFVIRITHHGALYEIHPGKVLFYADSHTIIPTPISSEEVPEIVKDQYKAECQHLQNLLTKPND